MIRTLGKKTETSNIFFLDTFHLEPSLLQSGLDAREYDVVLGFSATFFLCVDIISPMH